MKPGDTYYAPSYLRGDALWPVEILGRPHHGNVLVRWRGGPLAGREARLSARTLRKPDPSTPTLHDAGASADADEVGGL